MTLRKKVQVLKILIFVTLGIESKVIGLPASTSTAEDYPGCGVRLKREYTTGISGTIILLGKPGHLPLILHGHQHVPTAITITTPKPEMASSGKSRSLYLKIFLQVLMYILYIYYYCEK